MAGKRSSNVFEISEELTAWTLNHFKPYSIPILLENDRKIWLNRVLLPLLRKKQKISIKKDSSSLTDIRRASKKPPW